MVDNNMIFFAKTGEGLTQKLYLNPRMANRHGFICGATGTGKTVTLKVLAESFSKMGVPVFLSDVKGDLSGMVRPGEDNEGMQKRMDRLISVRISNIRASRRFFMISMVRKARRCARRSPRWAPTCWHSVSA